jgi:SAM-dependent methyltransferase
MLNKFVGRIMAFEFLMIRSGIKLHSAVLCCLLLKDDNNRPMNFQSVLIFPRVYTAFARLVGGKARRMHATEYIRAASGDRILDIGCGTGEILDSLPRDVSYIGFDMSDRYITNAKVRYAGRGEFFCAKITPVLAKRLGKFDIVLANGVLHHLTDEEAKDLLDLASRVLKPQGRLVTLDGCYESGQSPIAKFFLKRDRGHFVREAPAYLALAQSTFSRVAVHIRHDLLRIPYTLIIMECSD